jgi:hypothetical protein
VIMNDDMPTHYLILGVLEKLSPIHSGSNA